MPLMPPRKVCACDIVPTSISSGNIRTEKSRDERLRKDMGSLQKGIRLRRPGTFKVDCSGLARYLVVASTWKGATVLCYCVSGDANPGTRTCLDQQDATGTGDIGPSTGKAVCASFSASKLATFCLLLSQ